MLSQAAIALAASLAAASAAAAPLGGRVLEPAASSVVGPGSRPPEAAPRAALPYAPDESMQFRVEYLGLEAGRAEIAVGHREGRILPVFLKARTGGLAEIVDFRQQLATYLDVGTGLPRFSSMLSVEPSYRRMDTTRFDRRAGKATVRTQAKSDLTVEIDVPASTTDFVALVFRLRTLPLEPGVRHEFDVLAGKVHSRVVAEAEGRETLDTAVGRVTAIRVRIPTRFSGRFSEKHPTFVWFSDDVRRIIVRIRTDFAVGSAVAELVSYRPGTRSE